MKSESEEGDLGDVAMPGFVDILSSVLTVFMFFMMLTAAIMFLLSIQLRQNLIEEKKKEVDASVSVEIEELLKKLKSGEINIEDLKQQAQKNRTLTLENKTLGIQNDQLSENLSNALQKVARLQDSDAVLGKSADVGVSQAGDQLEIVVFYKDTGISVSDETQKKITEFIAAAQKSGRLGSNQVVYLEAPDNPDAPTITLSRQAVLGRALNIRNVLLTTKLGQDNIRIRNLPAEKKEDNFNWIRIKIEKKQ